MLPRLLVASLAVLALAGCKKPKPPPAKPAEPKVDTAFVEGAWSPALLEGTPKQGGTLVVRLPLEPSSLNRIIASDLWLTRMVRPAVYETLLRVDGATQPEYPLRPCLATGYDESPDHLTYTFHLRQGVKFHDGAPFTAKDVVATFDKLMNPKVNAQSMRALVEGLTSWKALDPYTVEFKFKEPFYLALRQLAASVPIMPASIEKLSAEEFNTQAPINRAPNGTGPWRFEKWTTGQEIAFVRNDAYWDDTRKPHLDKLVFRVVGDVDAAYEQMAAGELDVLPNIQAKQWVRMGDDPRVVANYRRFRYFNNNYGFLAWNEKRPVFADKRVRLALAELFDQDSFNENLAYGLELRTECIFFEASPACDPEMKPIRYDPEDAKKQLVAAGWADHDGDGILDKDGEPFRFRLMVPPGNEKLVAMATVLQQAYQAVGIDMQIEKPEWTVMLKRMHEHDFDAATMLWGLNDVEGDPYQVWHSSQAKGGSNWVSFDDPAADKLIEQGRREFDPTKRNLIWRALGREIHDQQPYMMLTVRPELEAVRKPFRGMKPSLAYYDFSTWWLDQ
ncbi:MAG: hypothetical protein JST54_14315 [Deltaproteobacteria bacterium]|nr:hypothetical protein [Deltaproteobacteria bacterium]